MRETERIKAALSFAEKKHEGQFRKGGDPYITHPVAVAEILDEKGFEEEYLIAGLFHDLLEDTDASDEEILKLGGPEVLQAVKLLTKEDGYVMAEYMAAIKSNDMAREIKAADRLHNLRSAVVADDAFKRKYIKETREWYMDFNEEIRQAVEALEKMVSDE
ncbi:MAG: HD domain-containing protein [Bacillota bacterium]|nr:HD domain-containing protein [Bacillota bacterium]